MNNLMRILITAALVLTVACSGPSRTPTTGVYMLIDTSGTYTSELDKAQQIISYLLARLNPGDSLAVARIDTGSFSEKDIVARATFDDRPSVANQQKRKFVEAVQNFVRDTRSSSYTDITGGTLQALEWLAERQPDRKVVLVFSDMKEDLPANYNRNIALAFHGVQVVAVNVTKLGSDNVNPQEYLDRLKDWQGRVENGGGEWRVINDLERLEGILPQG